MDIRKKLPFSLSRQITLSTSATHLILYALFFCSGCSALIYQILWQRMLFTIFGVDLESITIIVSVFMFGMGIGGLYGGYISDKLPSHLLTLYIIIEISIAIFGFASPFLINSIGNSLFSSNEFMTMISSFIILAIPTVLMGATFPILVTHINTYYHNVGRSVGSLYFINTLGGAVGAYLSGFVLLYVFTLSASIDRAALLNLAVAVTAFLMFRRQK